MSEMDDIMVAGLTGDGLARFLAWSAETDRPVADRVARIVLALLALRGAKVHDDVPELTASLLEDVLLEDIPSLITVEPQRLDDFPNALGALLVWQRERRRLNAKNQDRLRTALEQVAEEYHRRMLDPARMTWFRIYPILLADAGIDLADPEAVRRWMDEFDQLPLVLRREALAGLAPQPPEEDRCDLALRRWIADVDTHTVEVDSILLHRLARRCPAETDPETLTSPLHDRWSAAGLAHWLEERQTPYPDVILQIRSNCQDLAIGNHTVSFPPIDAMGDGEVARLAHASPLLRAAHEVAEAVERRGGVDCEPGSGPAEDFREEIAARLELGSAAVEEIWRFARTLGFVVVAGGHAQAHRPVMDRWASSDSDQVLPLMVDAVEAVISTLASLGRQADDQGISEAMSSAVSEFPLAIVQLAHNGSPSSLSRLAAIDGLWAIPYGVEDLDPVLPEPSTPPPGALGRLLRPLGLPRPDQAHLCPTTPGDPRDEYDDYRLPSNRQLGKLVGFDDVNEEERAGLLAIAHWHALLADRLAALGVMRRAGDFVALSRLGSLVLRTVLVSDNLDFPTTGEFVSSDTDALVRRLIQWPSRIATTALASWLNARASQPAAWDDLLAALSRGSVSARRLWQLLGVSLDLPDGARPAPLQPIQLPCPLPSAAEESALCSALDAAAADAVSGAYAAQALAARGRIPQPEVPQSARAVLLLDRLSRLAFFELRFHPCPEPEPADPDQTGTTCVGTAMCRAFDLEAATWPGGAVALTRALGEASAVGEESPRVSPVLETLAEVHQATEVAAEARAEVRRLSGLSKAGARRARSARARHRGEG